MSAHDAQINAQWSGSFHDLSGTIAVGGSSQLLTGANGNRKCLFVQNPSSATESLFVNFTSAAAATGSIELKAGASLIMDTEGFISSEPVNIFAATTGHAFVAKEA